MRSKSFFGIILGVLLSVTSLGAWSASGSGYPLQKPNNDLSNKASLMRGAQLYFNYCAGCHSLKYSRYEQIGEYIGAVDEEGALLKNIVQNNLNFVSDKVVDPVLSSMPETDAVSWFGVNPPDLTLVSRTRGTSWLYTYLKSFYVDESRPFGVNNAVFQDVGMPHVLVNLQGRQKPVYQTLKVSEQGKVVEKKVLHDVKLVEPGEMDAQAYDQAITDLVNFLEYVGEPVKEKRQRLGVYVLLFLIVLTAFLYALKREFWKDVH